MELLQDQVDRLPGAVSVVSTIGVFDGVHLGHQAILARKLGHDGAQSGAVHLAVHFLAVILGLRSDGHTT